MAQARVALIGLGLMGSGMARRLLGAGFPLTVYNRNPERAAPLAAEGAHSAASPREAASRADVVLSMVGDDAASRAVWRGEQGALAGAARGSVLVECSTLTVGWIEELAREAASVGCELLDAPVTGSKTHAASGELSFLVGGSAAALETARPVLSAMSRAIVHLGATGRGALLKLINNFLAGVQAASLAEALALIERRMPSEKAAGTGFLSPPSPPPSRSTSRRSPAAAARRTSRSSSSRCAGFLSHPLDGERPGDILDSGHPPRRLAVTHEALRVLQALEWSERTAQSPTLPMRRIATATLGGNDDLAAKILADLDLEGCVRTDMMGWSNGWLTSKGRVISLTTTGV